MQPSDPPPPALGDPTATHSPPGRARPRRLSGDAPTARPAPRRIRMSPEDRALDMWAAITVGPVDLPPLADLRAAFVRIASLGPRYRLALVAGDDRHWLVAGAALAERADEVIREIGEPVTSIREWLLEHRIPGLPLQFAVTDDHIGFLADHRLIDGTLARELLPLLIGAARGEWTAEPLDRLTERPLTEALWHSLGLRKPSWSALIQHLRRPRPWPEPAGFPARSNPDLAGAGGPASGVCHRLIQFEPEQAAALRRWSKGRLAPAPSLLLLASAALAGAGVATAPYGLMVVDLRRYLPRGRTYLGNFVTAVRVPPEAMLAEPRQANAWLTEALVKGRPLAAVALAAARARLDPRRAEPVGPKPDVSLDAPVTVSISHNGTLTAIDALPWLADPDHRTVELVSDVLDADTVGLMAYFCGGRLQLAASFRAERIPPAVMDAALAAMTADPAAVLDATR